MLETCGPPFESLETKGERVLAWGETIALVHHGLALGKHVSGFVVGHLEVPVTGSPDILWPMVIGIVLLGLDVRHLNAIRLGLVKLIGGDGSNRVVGWRVSGFGMRVRTWPVQLVSIDPFHTFIAAEPKGNSLGPRDHSTHIDEDLPVDCLPCKVDIFICLDKEISHQYITDYIHPWDFIRSLSSRHSPLFLIITCLILFINLGWSLQI